MEMEYHAPYVLLPARSRPMSACEFWQVLPYVEFPRVRTSVRTLKDGVNSWGKLHMEFGTFLPSNCKQILIDMKS